MVCVLRRWYLYDMSLRKVLWQRSHLTGVSPTNFPCRWTVLKCRRAELKRLNVRPHRRHLPPPPPSNKRMTSWLKVSSPRTAESGWGSINGRTDPRTPPVETPSATSTLCLKITEKVSPTLRANFLCQQWSNRWVFGKLKLTVKQCYQTGQFQSDKKLV